MRLMETIRRKGGIWILGFLAIFLISVFAGLGVGAFQFNKASNNPASQTAVKLPLVTSDQGMEDVAIRVNGREISTEDFNFYLDEVVKNMRGNMEDPAQILDAHAFASSRLVWESVVRQRGEELGVSVSADDIEEAKTTAIQPFMPENQGSSGNVIADLTRGLGSARDRKAAFNEFLTRNGLSEQVWRQRVADELYINNTTELIRDTANEEKKLEAEEKRVKFDEELAAGELFQEAVRKYSDDATADRGGDIGTWVSRGLLDEEIENDIFSLEKGETSDWHEVPVGFQKFHIYATEMPEGEELEEARQTAIETIKAEKGEEYEPSDEEIDEAVNFAEKKIKYYFVQLNTTVPNVAYEELQDLLEQAKIEINEPLVLAQQALSGDRLQPPAGIGFDELKNLAMNTAAGEGYDYSMIEKKLAAGRSKADTAAVDEEAAGQETAEDSADDTGAAEAEADEDAEATAADTDVDTPDDSAAEAPADPAADAEEIFDDPIYALAIGLMKDWLTKRGEENSVIANYLIAKTYIDWLDDELQAAAQPVDRTAAREEAEENFARAVERFNYSPQVYANRGLNLAWLDNSELATEQLEQAQKYAPQQPGGVWDTIREAYEIIGDEEKLAIVDALVSQMRQDMLEQQIRQATNQPGTSPDNPIKIDLGGGEEEQEAEEPSADETEPPAE